MEKKIYLAPDSEIVYLTQKCSILAGSIDDGQPGQDDGPAPDNSRRGGWSDDED